MDGVEEGARVGEAGGGGGDGVVVGGGARGQALHRLVGQSVQHLVIMQAQPSMAPRNVKQYRGILSNLGPNGVGTFEASSSAGCVAGGDRPGGYSTPALFLHLKFASGKVKVVFHTLSVKAS